MCKIMEETREEGIARGIAQGRLETTVKYYRKGAISAEEAAKDLGMTVEEFRKKAAEIALFQMQQCRRNCLRQTL